jgi:hypothetical protein
MGSQAAQLPPSEALIIMKKLTTQMTNMNIDTEEENLTPK